MSVLACFEPLDEPGCERRGAARLLLFLGTLAGPCGSNVIVRDLSLTGLMAETSAELEPGDIFEVELPYQGRTRATVVWRDGRAFGCQFEQPISRAAMSAALLRSDPSREPQQDAQSGGILTVGSATLAIAGLAYLFAIGSTVALASLTVVVGFALLIAGGIWLLGNTLQL